MFDLPGVTLRFIVEYQSVSNEVPILSPVDSTSRESAVDALRARCKVYKILAVFQQVPFPRMLT